MDFSLVDETAHYEPWIAGEVDVPSVLCVLLPGGPAVPAPDEVIARLRDARLAPVAVTMARSAAEDPTGWDFEALIERGGEPVSYRFSVVPSPRDTGPVPSPLDEHQRGIAAASEWAIAVEARYGALPLPAFHHHLQVMAAIVPEAVAYHDEGTGQFVTADWVRRSAASPAPPPTDALFTIHAVGPDDAGGFWLHTHGLDRCGVLELETVCADEDNFQRFARVLRVAASQFLASGPGRPGGRILLGVGIAVTWVPWESVGAAIGPLPDDMVGGVDDHDEHHDGPRASLLAAPWGEAGEPVDTVAPLYVLDEVLTGAPVFYLPRSESDRLRILARAELGHFASLLGRFGGTEGWNFRMKLGYPVPGSGDDAREGGPDGRSSGHEHEHLWFKVHGIDGGSVDATLTNDPHLVELARGQRGEHPLTYLSDFFVECPLGVYGPDGLGDLVLRLPA